MHGRTPVRLFQQDGGQPADWTEASVIQHQFRENETQVNDRGEDGKAVVCSRPR
jgi:hypothetical protein